MDKKQINDIFENGELISRVLARYWLESEIYVVQNLGQQRAYIEEAIKKAMEFKL
jgi:hypothetical protein